MIVIADTGPLNYLIQLGHADLLQELYGRVLIPDAVLRELLHRNAPEKTRLWAQNFPGWISVHRPEELDPSLSVSLGIGERQAISLALEMRAELLLIDDLPGRRAAESRHIGVAGTLSVLLQGALRGRVDFPQSLRSLKQLNFRITEALEKSMMDEYLRRIQ